MSAVLDAWGALEDERRREPGWHVRQIYPEAPCEIFAGIRQPGSYSGVLLELPVADVPAGLVLPRSTGFVLEPVLLASARDQHVRYALTLSDRNYSNVFSVLCEDVAATAARAQSARGALRDWVTRLHVWQAFMAKHGPGGMSESAVVGLIGELLVIRDQLIPLIGVRAALDAWSGPFGEPNDFALRGGFVEVKTTTGQAPEVLEIANSSQLDDTRGEILLVHVRLRPGPDGITLPQTVTDVRACVISEAPDRISDLDNLLMAVGYVPAQADLYTAAYTHERSDIFSVAGCFPRLKRCDVPPGVRNCTYTIDLDACLPFLATSSALVAMTGDSLRGR